MSKIKTTIYYSQSNIQQLVINDLVELGYEVLAFDIMTMNSDEIPEGATPGDCIGIETTIKKIKPGEPC